MPTLSFVQHALVCGERKMYQLKKDGKTATKSKNRKRIKWPKDDYKPGKRVVSKQASEMIKYVTQKLDWKLLGVLMSDNEFCLKHLEVVHLEIFAGKALLSGYLVDVKDLFKRCREETKLSKFSGISVSNAYFQDMIERGKRQAPSNDREAMASLIIMTLIKQGNIPIIKFALENLDDNISLSNAISRDGDMTYSVWAQTREVAELEEMTAAERLNEAIAKVKIFESYFEYETPLTAVLKASISREDSETLITLLLEHGADPTERNYMAFKVAARIGQVPEIQALLKHIKNVMRVQNKAKHFKSIYKALLAEAAQENQAEVIKFVRRVCDRPSAAKKAKSPLAGSHNHAGRASTQIGKNQRGKTFDTAMQDAIETLIKAGSRDCCTNRYRLLNGVFNLLNIKQQMDEAEIALANKLAIQANNANANTHLLFAEPEDDGETKKAEDIEIKIKLNDWTPRDTGILACNAVVNYNAAHIALTDDNAVGLGARLNTNSKISPANMAASGAFDSNRSIRSSASQSSRNLTGGSKTKRTLVPPHKMFAWLKNILQFNDFNGEKMAMVLFALGLRFFIGKPPKVKKNVGDGNESDAGSTWGTDSVASSVASDAMSDAGSVAGDETDNDDAKSVDSSKTDGTDFNALLSGRNRNMKGRLGGGKSKNSRGSAPRGGSKAGGKKRRRSTMSEMVDFFKDKGVKLKDNVAKKMDRSKSKIKSRDKVVILEYASEFGSRIVLNELLNLIVPQVSQSILKCIFISSEAMYHTHKLLLERVTEEFRITISDSDPKSDGQTSNSGSSRNLGSFASTRSVALDSTRSIRSGSNAVTNQKRCTDFLNSIRGFFTEFESWERIEKNKKNRKAAKKNKINVGPVRRKTLTEQARDVVGGLGKKITRRMSGFFEDSAANLKKKVKPKPKPKKKPLNKKNQTVKKLREQANKNNARGSKNAKAPNKFNGHSASTAVQLQRQMPRSSRGPSKRILKKNNANSEDLVTTLKLEFSNFLVQVLKRATSYRSYEAAMTMVENVYIDKTQSQDVVKHSLWNHLSRKRAKHATDRPVTEHLKLLLDGLESYDDIPAIAREAFEHGTANELPDVDHLRTLITSLTQTYKEREGKIFWTSKDLFQVLKSSTESNVDWDLWPEVVLILWNNMANTTAHKKSTELHEKIMKHAMSKKLSEEVKVMLKQCMVK